MTPELRRTALGWSDGSPVALPAVNLLQSKEKANGRPLSPPHRYGPGPLPHPQARPAAARRAAALVAADAGAAGTRAAADRRAAGAPASAGTAPGRIRRSAAVVLDATQLAEPAGCAASATSLHPLIRPDRPLRAGGGAGRAAGPSATSTRPPPSRRWRASSARSARRSAGGRTVHLVRLAPGAAADSTLDFLLSPRSAYVSGQVIEVGGPRPRRAGRAGRAADRAGHRGGPGHRRGGGGHPRPGRGARGVPGRAAGRRRARPRWPPGSAAPRCRWTSPRPTRRERDRRRAARRPRRPGAQRGHHPRPQARQHGRRALGRGPRGQPRQRAAGHRPPAQGRRGPRPRPDRGHRVHQRHRGQRRADQLRRVQGRRSSASSARWPRSPRSASAASPPTPSPPASSRPR